MPNQKWQAWTSYAIRQHCPAWPFASSQMAITSPLSSSSIHRASPDERSDLPWDVASWPFLRAAHLPGHIWAGGRERCSKEATIPPLSLPIGSFRAPFRRLWLEAAFSKCRSDASGVRGLRKKDVDTSSSSSSSPQGCQPLGWNSPTVNDGSKQSRNSKKLWPAGLCMHLC